MKFFSQILKLVKSAGVFQLHNGGSGVLYKLNVGGRWSNGKDLGNKLYFYYLTKVPTCDIILFQTTKWRKKPKMEGCRRVKCE